MSTPITSSSDEHCEDLKLHNCPDQVQHSDNDSSTAASLEQGPLGKESLPEENYPTGWKLICIMISLYLGIFLISLDRTIVSTAIPVISNDFHAFDDIAWIGGAYLITSCAFQLIFGKTYRNYSPKWVYVFCISIFEVGSVLCGAAPNATTLIVGRAIAGLGAAGVFSGAIVILTQSTPLRKRPLYTGITGAFAGLGQISGPLLGGLLTSSVSWRWCFYINLPIGAVAVGFVVLLLDSNPPSKRLTLREQVKNLDPFGTLVFIPCIVCLLLALQWGGTVYAWSSSRIIALFVLFGLLAIAFCAIQVWKKDAATVPIRIVKQRSILASTIYTFFMGGAFMLVEYYLPIFFQAIKGYSPARSGVLTLPQIAALVVFGVVSGVSISKIGYYAPFIIAGSVVMSIGSGLLVTLSQTTSHGTWAGFQVLIGAGVGLGMQSAGLPAQVLLEKEDVPIGVSLKFFGQILGGAIFIAVGEAVLANHLISGLSNLPGFDPHSLTDSGVTDLRTIVKPEYLPVVLRTYMSGIDTVFTIATVLSCLSVLGALAIEWKSVKGKKSR